jgi:phosphoribosylanthranilate isomerase
MVEDLIRKKYGRKVLRKRIPLSQEIRKTIMSLLFGLVLITVVLSIVFLLNMSNSAQKGYVHLHLREENDELYNINKELQIQVMKAKSMYELEKTDQSYDMGTPETMLFSDQ